MVTQEVSLQAPAVAGSDASHAAIDVTLVLSVRPAKLKALRKLLACDITLP